MSEEVVMYYSKLKRIEEIYDRLQDEESRRVFEARLALLIERNRDKVKFWKEIKDGKKWERRYNNDKEYIIFGAGKMGKHVCELLNIAGNQVLFFVDNDENKVGNSIDNIPIRSVNELLKYPEVKVIISCCSFEKEIKEQLSVLGIKNEIVREDNYIWLDTGRQYFDVFEPDYDEVFVDAGAYDGETIKEFIEWVGEKNYKHIYSFEPDLNSYNRVLEVIGNIERVSLINKGVYNSDTTLFFDNLVGGGAAQVSETGNCKIEVTSIDKVLDGDKATYIKMDVEGSEKEALIGAKETIAKHKPKLAICVYHYDFDFIELPLLLLEWNKEYKFFLRQYRSNDCETVLYAK